MDVELVPFPICEGMIPIPYGYRDYTVGNVAHQICRIFSSISTRKRLAAGLCPDPLGELERSPRPPNRTKGAYF